MRFSATIDYPADIETVATMLGDEAFVEDKIRASRAVDSSQQIVRDGAAFTITTRRVMPVDVVPARFRSFVGTGVDVRMVEAWQAAGPDGARRGTFSLDLAGLPVRVTGSMALTPNDAGCVQTYAGEVKASVPLVGGPIERAAVGAVQKVLDVERRLGLEHLARR